jgi:NADH dehydrogenase/NADH:ubiquinone oxidoreductase subunit G
MLEIVIDGQRVTVPEGSTVLQAIRQVEVHLPTLCYLEGLPPYGACRLCLVEIIEPESEVIAACAYPVTDDLVIRTDGERSTKVRNMMLEFLLARCPSSETIRELAADAGVTDTRFQSGQEEDELCILCGLCVRVCREAIGAAAIGFIDRGTDRKVGTPFEMQSEVCIGCGACAAVCPTDVIHIEDVDSHRVLQPWNTTIPLYTCPSCGEPYAPEPMAFLKEVVEVSAETWGMCPACRRRAVIAKLDIVHEPGFHLIEN